MTTDPAHADRLARLALSQLAEPGSLTIANALRGRTPVQLYASLLDPPGQPTKQIADLAVRLGSFDPQRDLDRAARLGIRWVVPSDQEWPAALDDLAEVSLLEMGGAPLGLWLRGPLRLDQLPRTVAIVGSRSSTTYGEAVSRDIAIAAAQAGFTVVSGAAFGIDQAAHRGALSGGGPTVAVLACGVDRAYPQAHKPLLDHLAAEGLVVSELAPGRSPMRERFLTRNRVIAALSLGTVVIEAAIRSGALNTASWTSLLNRPLMGVPGPVTSAPSEGVHQLIRSGAAVLVTRGEEVLELVGRSGEFVPVERHAPERQRDRLTQRQRQVLDAVPKSRPAPADSIARTAGIAALEVGSTLTSLAGRGLVLASPGGWRLASTVDE